MERKKEKSIPWWVHPPDKLLILIIHLWNLQPAQLSKLLRNESPTLIINNRSFLLSSEGEETPVLSEEQGSIETVRKQNLWPF